MSDAPSPAAKLLTHGIALVVGAALGLGGHTLSEHLEDPDAMARPEAALSRPALVKRLVAAEEQIASLRATVDTKTAEVVETNGKLEEAGKKVSDLQTQVEGKEGEIKVLELKVKKAAGKSAALQKELEEKKAELATLQAALDTALAEKAQLERDLEVSREETATAKQETATARQETEDARNDWVDAKWSTFTARAQVDICDVRWKSKLRKCKEDVATALEAGDRSARFKQCVVSGQATPRLVMVEKKQKDFELPEWSEWFDEESSFTKQKWYIVFCDPTLPEAKGVGRDGPGRNDGPEDLEDL